MSVSLQKGGNVNLSKEAPGLKKMKVGLGWDVRATDGAGFDLDATAFLLEKSGKVRNDADMIFFNCKKSSDNSIIHHGDNQTGAGDGDDESISIDFSRVSSYVEKIAICVTIHQAEERRQNFGMIASAYVRCINEESNSEIVKYDLSEDASTETAMIFGEVYRHNGDWKFKAIGQGFKGGLGPLARNFGVNVG